LFVAGLTCQLERRLKTKLRSALFSFLADCTGASAIAILFMCAPDAFASGFAAMLNHPPSHEARQQKQVGACCEDGAALLCFRNKEPKTLSKL
jgi:hypothetical protein